VPDHVRDEVRVEADVAEASCAKKYVQRAQTAYEHAWDRFTRFLAGRGWTTAEGPVALFDHSAAWLRRHRVLLPGVSVLARQVPAARETAEARLHAELAAAARRIDQGLLPATGGLRYAKTCWPG
jgi:hypothetical protein